MQYINIHVWFVIYMYVVRDNFAFERNVDDDVYIYKCMWFVIYVYV